MGRVVHLFSVFVGDRHERGWPSLRFCKGGNLEPTPRGIIEDGCCARQAYAAPRAPLLHTNIYRASALRPHLSHFADMVFLIECSVTELLTLSGELALSLGDGAQSGDNRCNNAEHKRRKKRD